MVVEHNASVPLNGNGKTSDGEGNVKQSECMIARVYQEDLLQKALKRNIIIPLGTGTGKTYVAVMLLKEMAGPTMIPISKGGKRSAFLVDKVPLVKQQAEQIRMHSTLNVGEFYGAMGVDLWDKSVWEEKLEKYQVLVMTAQILRNLLVHGYASINLFNVMVFDECHHATKNHPYRQIMSRYSETQGSRPRVLGLTASVVNNHIMGPELKSQIDRLESVMCSTIETTEEIESYLKVARNAHVKVKVCMDDEDNSWTAWALPVKKIMTNLSSLYAKADADRKDTYVPTKALVLGMLSKAQMTFDKLGLWSTGMFFHRQYQILKQQLKAVSLSCETERMFLQSAICSVEAINVYLRDRVESLNSIGELEAMVTPRVLVLLQCLRNSNVSSTNGKAAPFCGIVFVTERYVAYQLKVLLEAVIKLDPDRYGHLKVGFIVGQSAMRWGPSNRVLVRQCRRQEETLRRFRHGDINLIISTSILEEGIDVPQCNTVIRFDPPPTFSSFVQSKGRARASDAEYVVIIQKALSHKFCAILKSYMEMEQALLRHQYEIVNAEEDRPLDHISTDSLMPSYYGPAVNCVNGVEQAVVSLSTSLYVLNRYCMSLPCDRYATPLPRYDINSTTDSLGFTKFLATLLLPLNCPVKERITGPPMSNQKLAKMAVALKACELLHQRGQLSDNFLPISTSTESASVGAAREEGDEEEEEEFVEFTEKSSARGCNHREVYRRKVPVSLSTRLRAQVPLFLYQLQVKVSIPLLEVTLGDVEVDGGSSETIGLLCGAPMPRVPKFEIFANDEPVSVNVVAQRRQVCLTEDQLKLLFELQFYMFSELLNFKSAFLRYDVEHADLAFCIVPLSKESDMGWSISWALVNKLFMHIQRRNVPPTDEERRNFVYDEARYINSIVVPWYHQRTDTEDLVQVVGVRRDLNPMSKCDFGDFRSFAEYYEKRQNIKIFNMHQPLLCGDYLQPRLNMIHQRFKGELRKAIFEAQSSVSLTYTGSMFVPELLCVHPFPWSLWFKLTCMPTILHRLRCLIIADELRSVVHTEAFSLDAQITEDHEWQPVDSSWYRLIGDAAREHMDCLTNGAPVSSSGAGQTNVRLLVELDGMDVSYLEKDCTSKEPSTIWHLQNEFNDEDDFGSECQSDVMDTVDSLNSSVMSAGPFSSYAPEWSKSGIPLENDFCEDVPGSNAGFYSSGSVAVGSFLSASIEGYPLWPELRDILLALTSTSAVDHFDLENAETLGDSFLKYAVTDYLFIKYPQKHQGQLTTLRQKEISNANLCRLGKQIGLGGMMVVSQFKPMVTWLPPGFVMLKDAASESNTASNEDPTCADEYLRSSEEQIISDKRIADCVEALIGVYVRSCGSVTALRFMEWLGLSVVSEDALAQPTVTSLTALNQTYERLQLGKFERILRYEFKNRAYLIQALTHNSCCRSVVLDSYERLEFLGDVVLDYLTTRFIYEKELYKSPGFMTDVRSALVNNTFFASMAVKYHYHKYCMFTSSALYLAIGSFVKFVTELNGDVNLNTELYLLNDFDDQEKDVEEYEVPKVLGDLFESVAGAIYLDSGCSLEAVWYVYYPMMKDQIGKCCESIPKSPV
uniref:Endoribonuclease Dicer n=1 Tax=Trichuris muris TaxID=70415 RepID=A0A5S6R5U8_TRIMR